MDLVKVREEIVLEDTHEGFIFFITEIEYEKYPGKTETKGYVKIPKGHIFWNKAARNIPVKLAEMEIIAESKNNEWIINWEYPDWRYFGKKAFRKYQLLDAIQDSCSVIMQLKEAGKIYSTAESCLAAVKTDGMNLRFVHHTLKTPDVCLAAVKKDGRALRFIKAKRRTPELCIEAVKQNHRALNCVPLELKNQVKEALKESDS